TRAIDKIVDFITKKGKALWNKLKGKNGKEGTAPAADKNKNPGDRPKGRDGEQHKKPIRVAFLMQGRSHHLILLPSRRLLMASAPEDIKSKAAATLTVVQSARIVNHDQAQRLSEVIRTASEVIGLMEIGAKEHEMKNELSEYKNSIEWYAEKFDRADIDPEEEKKKQEKEEWERLVDKSTHKAPREYSGGKHCRGKDDVARRKKTKNGGAAQFLCALSEAQIKEMEREALLTGERTRGESGTFHAYKKFDFQTGWDEDSEAFWLRAEMTNTGSGTPTVHSHPRVAKRD
ncbi:hypothetical protein ACIQRK_37855, partial [Streptomyces anulatus]